MSGYVKVFESPLVGPLTYDPTLETKLPVVRDGRPPIVVCQGAPPALPYSLGASHPPSFALFII